MKLSATYTTGRCCTEGKYESLKKQLDDKCDRCIARDRAKAIKEFAERLKMVVTINNTNDGYLDYAVDYNCLIEDIDNIVKEMVGE